MNIKRVQFDVNVDFLRRIAILILNKSKKELDEMSDDELVLACVKTTTHASSNFEIVPDEENEKLFR